MTYFFMNHLNSLFPFHDFFSDKDVLVNYGYFGLISDGHSLDLKAQMLYAMLTGDLGSVVSVVMIGKI